MPNTSPSNQALQLILVAPSGCGKTTLLSMLVDEFYPRLQYSVSATTRPKREGEEDGKDYFFLTAEEFEKRVRKGDFAERARVYGHYYGTPMDFVREKSAEGVDLGFDLDLKGAREAKGKFPSPVVVFIEPPSFEELEIRLKERGTDSEEVIEERLKEARSEMKAKNEFDYSLINDDLEKVYKKLRAIYLKERR